MKFISHRGNITHKNISKENSPEYIVEAIKKKYYVEIDVFFKENNFYLGHDKPEYLTSLEWLLSLSEKLYVHAKNDKAVENLLNYKNKINFFYHIDDPYTITSKGEVWVHPNSKPLDNSIFVMPEINNIPIEKLKNSIGICSDNISYYKNIYNKLINK